MMNSMMANKATKYSYIRLRWGFSDERQNCLELKFFSQPKPPNFLGIMACPYSFITLDEPAATACNHPINSSLSRINRRQDDENGIQQQRARRPWSSPATAALRPLPPPASSCSPPPAAARRRRPLPRRRQHLRRRCSIGTYDPS